MDFAIGQYGALSYASGGSMSKEIPDLALAQLSFGMKWALDGHYSAQRRTLTQIISTKDRQRNGEDGSGKRSGPATFGFGQGGGHVSPRVYPVMKE